MGVLNVWNGSQWVPINVLGDHGTLSGLLDDDHTQYILVNGSRAFTSPVGGVTPTGSNQLATKGYVDSAIGGPYVSLSSFTGHTGDTSIHFTQSQININSSQISDLASYVYSGLRVLSGYFTGHTGDSTIHFTQSQISITSSQVSDLGSAIYTGVKILSGIVTGHTGNLSNPHAVTASQVGAPSLATFQSHTGDSTIHFTQGEIAISSSQVSDLASAIYTGVRLLSGIVTGHTGDSTIHFTQSQISISSSQISDLSSAIYTGTRYLSGLFTGHTGDATVHFTQGQISITSSQVSNFGSSVNSIINYLSGQFTGHTGDSTIHFTQNQILISSAQVSDFSSATYTGISYLSGLFTSHTGDSTVHFTQGQISITSSQVSDFGEAVDDRIGVTITGATGIKTNYDDANNKLYIYVSGLNHSILTNPSVGDDHSQYIYRYPSAASRNTIAPAVDVSALVLTPYTEGGTSDIFSIQNSALVNKIWVDVTGKLNILNSPTLPLHAVNLTYLTGNYSTKTLFTGHTGDSTIHFTQSQISISSSQVSDLSSAIYTGVKVLSGIVTGHTGSTTYHLTLATGNAAKANFGTGATNVPSGTDPRFFSLAYQQRTMWSTYDYWWANALNGWTTANLGSSSCYVYSPRFDETLQSRNDYVALVAVDGSTSTIKFNSTIVFNNNTPLHMTTGTAFKVRTMLNNFVGSHALTGRLGIWGNGGTPSPINRPTGVWFEYSSSKGPTWYAYASDGTVTTGVSMGIPVTGYSGYEFVVRRVDTNTLYYYELSSGTGVRAIITGLAVPSGANEPNGRFFGQIYKNNAAGAISPVIYIDYFAVASDVSSRFNYFQS